MCVFSSIVFLLVIISLSLSLSLASTHKRDANGYSCGAPIKWCCFVCFFLYGLFIVIAHVGMWWSAGTLTFTLNGEFLREAQTKLRGIYLPVLCVCAPVGRPAHVPLVLVTNFGAKPFRTDLRSRYA